jgi:hypothetical protein
MDYAVISGDIIASTSINDAGKVKIEIALNNLIEELKNRFKVYSRVIKGDYIECYVPEVANVFRVALAIKSFVKSINITPDNVYPDQVGRLRLFKTYGIRLAIGIGGLHRLDIEKGIIDGEAIYFSGRIINENKTHNKEKVTIKNTMFIKSNDDTLDKEFQPLLALIDVLISKNTEKQCEVLYLKLLGYNEESIVKKLNQRQSTINEKSTIAGWNAIENAVQRFEDVSRIKFA